MGCRDWSLRGKQNSTFNHRQKNPDGQLDCQEIRASSLSPQNHDSDTNFSPNININNHPKQATAVDSASFGGKRLG